MAGVGVALRKEGWGGGEGGVGRGLDYFAMYIFGGLPAFGVLYGEPENIYLPKTFLYLEQLVGIESDVTSIVGDKVFLNQDVSTNTFTIFGVLYKYFNLFSIFTYIFVILFENIRSSQ